MYLIQDYWIENTVSLIGNIALGNHGAVAVRVPLRHQVPRLLPQGDQAVDHHGVLGRRIGLGSDEGRQLRGEPYRHHSERSTQGAGLLTQ